MKLVMDGDSAGWVRHKASHKENFWKFLETGRKWSFTDLLLSGQWRCVSEGKINSCHEQGCGIRFMQESLRIHAAFILRARIMDHRPTSAFILRSSNPRGSPPRNGTRNAERCASIPPQGCRLFLDQTPVHPAFIGLFKSH